MAFSQSSIL